MLGSTMRKIRRDKSIVYGDLNAKSPRWFSNRAYLRGRMVASFIDRLDLGILNRSGELSTFCYESRHETNIDVTVVSLNTVPYVRGWTVGDWAISDHRPIEVELGPSCKPRGKSRRSVKQGRANFVQRLKSGFQPSTLPEDLDERGKEVAKRIVMAAGGVSDMGNEGGAEVWWTDDLQRLKNEVRKVRSVIARDKSESNLRRNKEVEKPLGDFRSGVTNATSINGERLAAEFGTVKRVRDSEMSCEECDIGHDRGRKARASNADARGDDAKGRPASRRVRRAVAEIWSGTSAAIEGYFAEFLTDVDILKSKKKFSTALHTDLVKTVLRLKENLGRQLKQDLMAAALAGRTAKEAAADTRREDTEGATVGDLRATETRNLKAVKKLGKKMTGGTAAAWKVTDVATRAGGTYVDHVFQ
ncbi:UNVERIFIED_CONTAM: hypothetical protein PYX00_010807 [Menopon gallinae]|uniref:Endonuclease/exonuclease/phosphatase domain-containing protein n=1 Tax=Menopon gallinae TaxID=328185 RepID=A0AAW2HGW4_9NEOP